MTNQEETIKCAVVKLGSSVTITRRGRLDKFRIAQLVKQTRLLKERGFVVVFVISGAVVCGENILSTNKAKNGIAKRLAAGVGQAYVISELYRIFKTHGFTLAQMLLTKNDLGNRKKQEEFKNILRMAIETNIVLVMNENDVVDLHSFGGNDFLAGKIAQLLHADWLLLLTDVDGVYSEEKQILQTINANKSGTSVLYRDEEEDKDGRVGGICSKVEAAKVAAKSGIQTIIANGKLKDILVRLILDQEELGTKVSR